MYHVYIESEREKPMSNSMLSDIQNDLSAAELSFRQIASKYNMALDDVEMIADEYVRQSAIYLGEPILEEEENEE
jgi:hypothetical protein